jgi:tRNA 2-thiouridine synthesizing protein C
MKKYLFVFKQSAHTGNSCQELLDMVLMAAAFDQDVTLLFLDAGVFQLKRGQQPGTLLQKDTLAMFKALPLYEVAGFYVEQESLYEQGLTLDNLCLPVTLVKRQQLGKFIGQFDLVFSS